MNAGLILVGLAAGMLGAAAGVAHADPGLSDADQQLVDLLARHDVRNSYGPAAMVEDGHEVCAALDGFTFDQEVMRILATNLDPDHAVYFERLSGETYCPARAADTGSPVTPGPAL